MNQKREFRQAISAEDTRTHDQILQHYLVEKELAGRLRSSTREERRELYSQLYDELFRRVPHHPQVLEKQNAAHHGWKIAFQMSMLKDLLNPNCTFLELGAGDCSLSFEIARHVEKVYAVDVSSEITGSQDAPSNYELIISNGCTVPVPARSVNVAYSNQLMEHLHPEDAVDQVKEIYNALVPGGAYLCLTPHRFYGPNDVSGYFDTEAQGFHLKEYTNSELTELFKAAGFSTVAAYRRFYGRNVTFPVGPVSIFESLLQLIPSRSRSRISRVGVVKSILGIRLIAIK